MLLQVTGESNPNVLKLVGELDLSTGKILEDVVQAQVQKSSPLVLDLSELTFMDSTGLRLILKTVNDRNGGPPLVLLHPTEPVRRLLALALPPSVPGLEIQD